MIPSKLILQSGEQFPGLSPQWQTGDFFGEVVFTTGMTGYVESLTDPSYAGQILVFTYPLIGNYGVPDSSFWESEKIQASGVVVGTASSSLEHWNGKQSFLDWLAAEQIPLLSNVDTRALTKVLRKNGVALGAITAPAKTLNSYRNPNETDLISKVTCKEKKIVNKGPKRIIAVDCGMKENIMRCLSRYPLEIVRVPYDFDYSAEEFDGLFISNGPGDPAQAKATIAILQKGLARKKPTFGICLGAQIMALAIGAKTYKLKFGHRGQNHPCLDLKQKKAILTSQNHGYAIEKMSLPSDWETTFISLNDNSVEGIAHKTLPFFAVQFHPESHPGPTDAAYLFDKFYEML
jgi:carbamoyl-phosphate synthase small subunit